MSVTYITLMFLIGAGAYINASKIILDFRLFLICGALYYLVMLSDVLAPIAGIFLTYCTVYVGMSSFLWFDRWLRVDLSYGIYLYGFPITQAVIWLTLPHMNTIGSPMVRFALILPAVTALTIFFSYLSWTWIEKPSLKLRKHRLLQPRPKAVIETSS